VEHEPSGRGGSVDVLGQRPEPGPTFAHRLDNVEKVSQGAGESVVLRHHDHVAGPELLEQPVQLGPPADSAGDPVPEDALRPDSPQCVELGIEVLVVGGDAGVDEPGRALGVLRPWRHQAEAGQPAGATFLAGAQHRACRVRFGALYLLRKHTRPKNGSAIRSRVAAEMLGFWLSQRCPLGGFSSKTQLFGVIAVPAVAMC
jgi:hypothetical protein